MAEDDAAAAPSRAAGDHPSEQELERFLGGKLAAARWRVVADHLQTKCPRCRVVMERLNQALQPPQRPPRAEAEGRPRRRRRRGEVARSVLESEAQALLREIAWGLAAIPRRLEGLLRGLPPSPQELQEIDGEAEPDVTTEIRNVVRSVVNESLRPAIDDLLAAAEYQPRPLPELAGGGVLMEVSEGEPRREAEEDGPAAAADAEPQRRCS